MAKKELVKIETFAGEEDNSTVYVMSLPIKGLNLYERAKAIKRFVEIETKVLEQVLESNLRHILRANGIIPQDGSNQALEKAITELEIKGKTIQIIDRYYEIGNEHIVGESPNHMTVIEEEEILSCAIEVVINNA